MPVQEIARAPVPYGDAAAVTEVVFGVARHVHAVAAAVGAAILARRLLDLM